VYGDGSPKGEHMVVEYSPSRTERPDVYDSCAHPADVAHHPPTSKGDLSPHRYTTLQMNERMIYRLRLAKAAE
jgi:hypothetical protein